MAEPIGHVLPRSDRGRLRERFEVFLTPQMLDVFLLNGNIGCKHRGGDLAAVCAVADEDIDKTGAFCWLQSCQRGTHLVLQQKRQCLVMVHGVLAREKARYMSNIRSYLQSLIALHHSSRWPSLRYPLTSRPVEGYWPGYMA